jgi:hypothetical protein
LAWLIVFSGPFSNLTLVRCIRRFEESLGGDNARTSYPTPNLRAVVFDVNAFYIAPVQSVTPCRSVHFFQAKHLTQRPSAKCRWLWRAFAVRWG